MFFPMIPTRHLLAFTAAFATGLCRLAAQPREVSGIYPHLAMFNAENECGTGAVVPWADRLWVITYGPHLPKGSTDKLYEITPALEQIIRPESIGGTPANRMIHRESQQLFIGPYAIDAQRQVRAIPYTKMFGRHTGLARHLTDPAGKIVFATMEEGIYEVDVKTLAPTTLWVDEQVKDGRHAELPGYHGKGFYSAQGRYVYANNGDHAREARTNPAVPSGALAEWDGKAEQWTVVRRNQFTEVTGPGGIEGSAPDAPMWSIGWDHRSLILMLLDGGKWQRVPPAESVALLRRRARLEHRVAAHPRHRRKRAADDDARHVLEVPAHVLGREQRRHRTALDVSESHRRLLPLGRAHRARLRRHGQERVPQRRQLKGKIAGPGQSQSNLWFVPVSRLDECGPALGRGAVWLKDDVKTGESSEPFLFSGFDKRSLHLAHEGIERVTFTLEVDAEGNGKWSKLREISVPANGGVWTDFTPAERGAWIRLIAQRDATKVTAFFHYRNEDRREAKAAAIFDGIAKSTDAKTIGGLLRVRDAQSKTLRCLTDDGSLYDLDAELRLRKADAATDADNAAWMATNLARPKSPFTIDAASVLHVDSKGKRWRLPKGGLDLQPTERICREVSTERNLLNIGGTFYELPAENAGGFIKLRPITTHNRRISDFASYRGLLVISGITAEAKSDRIFRSENGECALWCGVVDDLWQFGKPRGTGGPWHNTAVKAGVPSDAYLATGYDRKRLTLTSSAAAAFRIEADFTGTGEWSIVACLNAQAGKKLEHEFPDAFGAYWLRLVAETDTTATAVFTYE